MDYESFKKDALVTEGIPPDLGVSNDVLITLLRAAASMGQLVDAYKRIAIYRKPIDKEAIEQDIITVHAQLANLTRINNSDATLESSGISTPNIRITHGALGMFTEAGEILEAVIRSMETGMLDLVNIGEETADSDWYKMVIHDETGVSEPAARSKVIAKLRKRFGAKFDAQAALNRDVEAERKVLEA